MQPLVAALNGSSEIGPSFPHPKTLHSSGYFFNAADGRLCLLASSEPFTFVSKDHYEEVCQLVLHHIQTQMQTDPYGALQEIWLPLCQPKERRRREQSNISTRKRTRQKEQEAEDSSIPPPLLHCNVFMSPSNFEGDKLLIFICGMGPVRYHPPHLGSQMLGCNLR